MARAVRQVALSVALAVSVTFTAAAAAVAAPNGSDREWELVTHPGESAGVVTPSDVKGWTSDGKRVLFATFGVPLDPEDLAGTANAYGAAREPGGWTQWRLTPAFHGGQEGGAVEIAGIWGWSSDFETAIWQTRRGMGPGAPGGTTRYFRVERGGTDVTLLAESGDNGAMWGSSPDARTYLFRTGNALVPPDVPPNTATDLYLYDDGAIRFVGKTPAGGTFECGSDWGSDGDPRRVSDDWSRVFFRGYDCTAHRTYVYDDGEVTEVAASQCSRPDCDSPQEVQFVTASVDGAKALVSTSQQLVDGDTDSSRDLYLYDVSSGALDRVSAVRGAGTPGDAEGILGASRDLRRIYFMSRGSLTDDPDEVPGTPNLYLWADGALTHLTTLAEDDFEAWRDTKDRTTDVTPDGRRLLLDSSRQLADSDVDAARDVFLFDAADMRFEHVSVGVGGTGNESVDATVPQYVGPGRMRENAVTPDGSRAFFVTSEALVPHDGNATPDIYERHAGATSLVTSGRGDAVNVEWIGASDDGSTVFFMTAEALSARDLDGGAGDLYAARLGGGFAEPPAPPAACEGDACQGVLAGAPATPPIASVGFAGDGNLERVGRVAVSGRAARGSVAVLKVRTPSAGRVAVSGRGVRTRRLGAPRAGTYRVAVRLSKGARRTLLRRGALSARVRVSFTPRRGASSLAQLTLRFKAKDRR
jgi:hypothetical protein